MSGCILTLSILVIGQFFINRQTLSHSPALQLKVAELKAVARVDSIRLENIKRVLAVINRFNPRMPESVKTAIASEISAASVKYENLDIDLLCATITHESAFTWDPQVISPAGAMGLMQVMPFWLNEIGISDQNLFKVRTNLRMGCTILRYYMDMEPNNLGRALARYNGSLGRTVYPNKVIAALHKHWFKQ